VKRNNFLILGNGADINEIDFNQIDVSFITGGVNRIYLRYIPEYYYIYDLVNIMPDFPIKENIIYTHTSKLSEYLRENVNNTDIFHAFPCNEYTTEFVIINDKIKCNHSAINMLIRILNDYLFSTDDNYFYVCGVPLLESEGHFYDESINHTPQKVLDKIYNDFIRLAHRGYKIVSCMKESKLNNLFPNEDKSILYNFKEKKYNFKSKDKIFDIIKRREYALS
jgi:hypothetical protein